MSEQSCCKRCRFYLRVDDVAGECIRFPPSLPAMRGTDGVSRYPKVYGRGLCGEFVDRETGEDLRVTPTHVIGRLQARIRDLEGEATMERLRDMVKGNTGVRS